jgi:Glyoxalase-like domain
VPEERAGKNRLHLDLTTDEPASDLERLTDLGTVVQEKRSDSTRSWWILADPEGNVLCLG